MSAIVFAGPSLRREDASAMPSITIRPPATCGDIARAVLYPGPEGPPSAIGLIDGLFETVAAPWHKEILWVMQEGVHVFGAASMGAIRAAELAPFGMIGVGWVYDAYRSGDLEADDEVAVLHGPAQAGYPLLTDALVNIRVTLAKAQAASAINGPAHDRLLTHARALHFKERTWSSVLASDPALTDEIAPYTTDVKAADARLLLNYVSSSMSTPMRPPNIPETVFLEALLNRIREEQLRCEQFPEDLADPAPVR